MRLTQRNAIIIAVVCAALAAVLIFVYLQGLKPKQPSKDEAKQVDVVVPLADIAPSSIITPDMVAQQTVKAEDAPKGAVSTTARVVGYVAIVPLRAQQPIRSSEVAPRGTALGLAGMVPPGMRAVTVALDPVTGVAGLLKPGDRVDVVATFKVADTVLARTVLQDVELLALGQQIVATPEADGEEAPAEGAASTATGADAKAGAAKSGAAKSTASTSKKSSAAKDGTTQPNATLAVTPQDAQRLTLADQQGELRLALRPVGEHDIVPIPATDVANVAGPEYVRAQTQAQAQASAPSTQQPTPAPQGSPPPPGGTTVSPLPPQAPRAATRPPKPPPSVEVIRGGQREHVTP